MSDPIPPSPSPIDPRLLPSPSARLAASIIDGVLQGVLTLIPFGLVAAIAYGLIKDALPFLNGQSIGKRAMGIRAVRVTDGSPITNDYATALVRQISLYIPIFDIVDMLMVFSSDHRRFGDRWAGTIVVKAE